MDGVKPRDRWETSCCVFAPNTHSSSPRVTHFPDRKRYRLFAIFIMSKRFVLPLLLSLIGASIVILSGASYDSKCDPPCVQGDESIMSPKEHGTSNTPVQENLRWDCDWKTADRICNYNRRYAEQFGYFARTDFLINISDESDLPMVFYDSNTGKPLFEAPEGRSLQEFLQESMKHGWPSFRDAEVNWENVRILPGGETVSVDGTHLGHNIPDGQNRYCINLVSVAGSPPDIDELR